MIAASHIYQMMLDADVSNVKCLTFANADVAEFTVPENAKITKNKVKRPGTAQRDHYRWPDPQRRRYTGYG